LTLRKNQIYRSKQLLPLNMKRGKKKKIWTKKNNKILWRREKWKKREVMNNPQKKIGIKFIYLPLAMNMWNLQSKRPQKIKQGNKMK